MGGSSGSRRSQIVFKLQETMNKAEPNGKTLVLFSLLIGLLSGVFFSTVLFNRRDVEEPAINMGASPMSMSCLRVPAMSVTAMQNILRKNGVPYSPMEKFALTSFAATRDVSMRAQTKEELPKLDHDTQTKLKKLGKELVVRATTRRVAAFNPEDKAGVCAPLQFWDPAGLAKDEESFNRYRQAELKHGRVCMSSSLGMLIADKLHPIFDNWNDEPFVSSAVSHFSPTARANFWPAFWVMTAGHEFATTFKEYEGKEEGDYGWDPLNLRPEDPEKLKEYKTMELNHGRWAMFCAAGILAQELVSGPTVV